MSVSSKDKHSSFKEKIWTKDDDGEIITDGYSFRGKRAFGKAVEGFREMMKKGAVGEINEVKFKVLDTRKNGAGLDIEIELTVNKDRGISVMKLYGPNNKKQNVVTINKSKGSDYKYVTTLAEKIVKPLIIRFLEGDNVPDIVVKPSVSVRGKMVKLLKCPKCDKTSYSAPGLKGHITKMHNDKADAKHLHKNSILNSDHIKEEASKVVDLLIKEAIVIHDDKEESIDDIEEVTLDETCEEAEETSLKKYCNKCETCDFTVDASRRYIAIQLQSIENLVVEMK